MKKVDKKKFSFYSEMIDVTMSVFNASCGAEDSRGYMQKIYDEYIEDSAPESKRDWLIKRLAGDYRYISKPPAWIEKEPTWPYHLDKPMVFITQHEIPEEGEDLLGQGYIVYVFGAKEPVPEYDGWQLFTKVITQHYMFA